MLRLSLVGFLGADPELRSSQKGTPMATFRVAVNQIRPDTSTGERQETTEWFRVRAMGRLADFSQRLSKGSRALVIGRLDISHYRSRDGEERVGYDVWADEVIALGPLREAEVDASPSAAPSSPPGARSAGKGRPVDQDASDDLPF